MYVSTKLFLVTGINSSRSAFRAGYLSSTSFRLTIATFTCNGGPKSCSNPKNVLNSTLVTYFHVYNHRLWPETLFIWCLRILLFVHFEAPIVHIHRSVTFIRHHPIQGNAWTVPLRTVVCVLLRYTFWSQLRSPHVFSMRIPFHTFLIDGEQRCDEGKRTQHHGEPLHSGYQQTIFWSS